MQLKYKIIAVCKPFASYIQLNMQLDRKVFNDNITNIYKQQKDTTTDLVVTYIQSTK